MDNNHRRDNNGFFKPEGEHRDDDKQEARKQESKEYYYSYGPFKSSRQENHGEDEEELTTSMSSLGETSAVDVTPPQPLRPPTAQTWAYPAQKKRIPFKSMFASFMAGVLVVGTLMFAADKTNLFTGDQGVFAGGSGNDSTADTLKQDGDDGGVENAGFPFIRPNNIAEIAENASPAVVKIESYVKAQSRNGGGRNPFFNDPFFRQFLGDDFFGSDQQDEPAQEGNGTLVPVGMGSGFIFDKSGYILTNEHVIDGAAEVRVYVQGYNEPFKAKVLGNSFDLDLAALKIEGDKDFHVLKMGSEDELNVGDWVVAIGNPYGFDHTVTVGVLSAKERPITIPDQQATREYEHLLQTDASINPGNSGGPLLNLNGEVIGINTAVSTQAQGIGFAIPTSTIFDVLEQLKNNKEIPKPPAPFIGIELSDIQQEWVKDLKLEGTDGSLVKSVVFNSPAHKAGISVYDVVVAMNGSAVKNSEDLVKKVKETKVGNKVTLTMMRNGKKINVTVTIGDQNKAGK